MKRSGKILALAALALSLTVRAEAGIFSKLWDFAGGTADGAKPRFTTLELVGGSLYGLTEDGGSTGIYQPGTFFKVDTDGSNYQMLRAFTDSTADGYDPFGSLTFYDNMLYGMTRNGGQNSKGTLFNMDTSGGNFSILRSFGGPLDGSNPYGTPVVAGGAVYGMTYSGGNGKGVLFKQGAEYGIIRRFEGGASDGASPYNCGRMALSASGDYLYGTTTYGGQSGGASDLGVIFSLKVSDDTFSIIHTFVGGSYDGVNPNGSLTLVGDSLYGVTNTGGENDLGTVFKIGTGGGDISILHSFNYDPQDGMYPMGSLAYENGQLYGMTMYDSNSNGAIFSVGTGGGFSLLYVFDGTDGKEPWGGLTLVNGKLFGMTNLGGANGKGVLFYYDTVPEPSAVAFFGVGILGLLFVVLRKYRRK